MRERQPLLASYGACAIDSARSSSSSAERTWPNRPQTSLKARGAIVGLGAAAVLFLLLTTGSTGRDPRIQLATVMNGANTLPGSSASRVAAAEATALSQPALQLDAYSDILTDTACIDSSLPVLGGVDVVAYFSLEKGSSAVKGDSRISCLYQGFTFYFATRSNKALFEASPAKYAPKWGNFCAYGIAYEQATWGNPSNRLGPPFDPDAWHIASDGRLYIFKEIKVVSHFTANETRAIARGDAFWQRVTGDCAACFNTLCSCDNGPDLSLCTCPPHGEACGNRHVPNSASSATA